MKWLTDDEFLGTEIAIGVNLVEEGDRPLISVKIKVGNNSNA